jgi:cytidylate kinase
MPLITITQSIGSDGLAVARRVANDLHVGLYDDPKLREEAVRMGLDVGKLDGFQEKAPTWFHRLMGDKPEVYAHLIGSVIYEAARSGDGVIIGHGSQVLLKDFSCAMHVLVTATTERRINNLMGQNLTREAAEKVIRKSDSQNKEFFRFTFHRHWDDPSLYDLCINPDKIGIERASQTIVETARYPELKACNIYALDAIERFSLTKRIEAALVEMNLLPMGTLVEMPEKGIVRISGVLDDQEDEERIAKVVRSIPGVEKLELDVLIVPARYV